MQAATHANELKLKRITVRGRILHTMKTINVFLCIKEHTFRYSQTYKADMLCKRCWFWERPLPWTPIETPGFER